MKAQKKTLKLSDVSKNRLSVLAALSAGLYPLTFLYKSNHTLYASWYHIKWVAIIYIVLPIIIFLSTSLLGLKIKFIDKHKLKVLTVLNLTFFTGLLLYSAYGLQKKLLILAILIAVLLGVLVYKHLLKIIKFQFLLAIIGIIFLMPILFTYTNYNKNWLEQDNKIESVQFKKTPNIYLIQPDGYVGLSELTKGNYGKDTSAFANFLLANGFTLYPNFRSNYYSTLSSNASLFAMKHHYFHGLIDSSSELMLARDIITSDNPVLNILRNNNYTTSLILENSYLLASRPKIGYDYCNVSYKDLSVFAKGFEFKRNVLKDLENAIKTNDKGSQFYFVEKIIPGHIATLKSTSKGKEIEKELYLKRLEDANKWLAETIKLIETYDANSLIIIASDHGGFVGYDYSSQAHQKPNSKENTLSMFSSLLAIKWPDNPKLYDADLNTSVNLFRSVFSYLSSDTTLLDTTQEDKSYLLVTKDAPQDLYEVIDENGNVVFKTFNLNEKL
ncbi:MAG: hypothetical protein HKN40_13750 [Winogradskyella sp.]|uniref:hypothetical protein n=1 Tax=Winogradskyella sp. TaxID=1883156 RepID=UPI0017B13FBA|nr:hypothetical protein [Winogradskyella sp.]